MDKELEKLKRSVASTKQSRAWAKLDLPQGSDVMVIFPNDTYNTVLDVLYDGLQHTGYDDIKKRAIIDAIKRLEPQSP